MDTAQMGLPNNMPQQKDQQSQNEQTPAVDSRETAVPQGSLGRDEDKQPQMMDKAEKTVRLVAFWLWNRRWPIIGLLLLAVIILLVAVHMPLRPMPGLPQVVARRNLEKDRQLTRDDLDTVWPFRRPDVFTDTQQLVHAYVSEKIDKGKPILHSQVKRYQVVAKQELDAYREITAADIELALTAYRTEAYTDTNQVIRLYTRQPISKGLTILSSVVDPKYVVAKWDLDANQPIAETDLELAFLDKGQDDYFTGIAQIVGLYTKQPITASMPIRERQVSFVQVESTTDLEAGHLFITTTGLITESLDHYTDTVFTKPSQLLHHYTLTGVKSDKPILKSQVEPCQVVAAWTMPAYHLIEAESDLTVEKEVCEPISGTITSKWEGRYTSKAIEAGTVIQDADLVPGAAPYTNTVAVSFAVPASSAFGGNLKAGDMVNIFLVQHSEAVTPTIVMPITGCLLLSVEEIAPGQTAGSQAAEEEPPPPEPRNLIVAAIPKADEQKFIMWLPSSHVILSVGTKR